MKLKVGDIEQTVATLLKIESSEQIDLFLKGTGLLFPIYVQQKKLAVYPRWN